MLEIVWSEAIWCPSGITWSDFTPENAQFKDLGYSIVTAIVLLSLRFILTKLFFERLAIFCGLKAPSAKTPTQDNAYLERILYEKKQKQQNGDITTSNNNNVKTNNLNGSNSSENSDLSEFQIKRYLRLNTFNKKKQSTIDKFTEVTWRCAFYAVASIYGWCFVLPGKPYRDDTLYCFLDYPNHPVTDGEWWYYNIELGFYISLMFSQFFDTKRKDFWQMFVHHICTIALIVLSWACNFHRVGCLVLAIHDVADVPLEGAKLARYLKRQRLADAIFVIFAVTWIYSRCYLLPTKIIYYTAFEALKLIPVFPAYYIFNALLIFLQLLHFVWTWLILKIAYYAFKNKGMRDLRSDTEESHTD